MQAKGLCAMCTQEDDRNGDSITGTLSDKDLILRQDSDKSALSTGAAAAQAQARALLKLRASADIGLWETFPDQAGQRVD